jgi:CheY-like chemotaxis protein
VNCRSCYSIRATSDSQFFVADILAFGLVASLVGQKGLTHMANHRLDRRCKHFARGKSVEKSLNRTVQELKANELSRLSRQKLRLPRCAGYPAVEELENLEDYLDIIMDHRRAPPDVSALPELACLESLGIHPKTAKKGPGLNALFQAAAQEARGQTSRRSKMSLRDWFEPSSYDSNPMGGTVSSGARYAETAPPRPSEVQLAIEDGRSTLELTRCESSPQISGTGSLFLHTEVDFDDITGIGMSLALEEKTMSTSISLPSLTQAHSIASLDASRGEDIGMLQKELLKKASSSDRRSDARSAATKRHQRVMKAFTKATSGKSILLFTDQKEVRKKITSVLLNDDTKLRFIKSSNDLWPRLRDPKEQYHALLIDLSKNELPIAAILRAIRQDARYAKLPIVVLSEDRNLPDVVRAACSFVVFLPLAAGMLREALVWCFDRASIQKLYKSEEEQLDLQCVRNMATSPEPLSVPPEIS